MGTNLYFPLLKGEEIAIAHWPTPGPWKASTSSPPPWLGRDPVLGRISCPPMIRWHASKQTFELLLLKDIKIAGLLWTFHLRKGLYWWDGEEVTGASVLDFLKESLAVFWKERGELYPNPKIYQGTSPEEVHIEWPSAPLFGPWSLVGQSLWKKSISGEFVCAGIYKPMEKSELELKTDKPWKLTPQPLYKQGLRNIVFHTQQLPSPSSGSKTAKILMIGDDENFWQRGNPDEPVPCKIPFPTQWVSFIRWSSHLKSSSKKELTSKTPRGALLRQGGGFWGKLSSSLIPPHHPWWSATTPLIPFSPQEKLKKDFPLKKLRLAWPPEASHTAKVFKDIFWRLWKVSVEQVTPTEADGVFQSLLLPWPDLFLAPWFHQNFPNNLELYKSWLSYEKDMSWGGLEAQKLLAIVQKVMAEEEPLTILFHHHGCWKEERHGAISPDFHNPDWFKNWVLSK